MPGRIETLKYKSVSKEREREKKINPGIYNRIMIVFSLV
jgi:hypothetical protein